MDSSSTIDTRQIDLPKMDASFVVPKSKGKYIFAIVAGIFVFIGAGGFGAVGLLKSHKIISLPETGKFFKWLSSAFETVGGDKNFGGLWGIAVSGIVIGGVSIAFGAYEIHHIRRQEILIALCNEKEDLVKESNANIEKLKKEMGALDQESAQEMDALRKQHEQELIALEQEQAALVKQATEVFLQAHFTKNTDEYFNDLDWNDIKKEFETNDQLRCLKIFSYRTPQKYNASTCFVIKLEDGSYKCTDWMESNDNNISELEFCFRKTETGILEFPLTPETVLEENGFRVYSENIIFYQDVKEKIANAIKGEDKAFIVKIDGYPYLFIKINGIQCAKLYENRIPDVIDGLKKFVFEQEDLIVNEL